MGVSNMVKVLACVAVEGSPPLDVSNIVELHVPKAVAEASDGTLLTMPCWSHIYLAVGLFWFNRCLKDSL